MRTRRINPCASGARRALGGGVLAAAVLAVGAVPASAATTASLRSGVLTVIADSNDNTIELSRNAAGALLINGGAVVPTGGAPTVANTSLIRVFAGAGNDIVTISEVQGALPKAAIFGSSGNDTATGGSGADQLFGQAGNDTLLGKGGADELYGGADNDTLTGGDADDRVHGNTGNDRLVWNPGDDTDLNEGGHSTDTVEVNGGGGTEQFTTTANGTRVRFDRVNPAPFSLDINAAENLVLNANGGDDSFSNTGNLTALIRITADGGSGKDTLLGSNGADILLGGSEDDFVDGQQGNDVTFLGAGNDTAQWDPGDGSDVIEGQDGSDHLVFNGSGATEVMRANANGSRVLFSRDVASIVMDLNDVEQLTAKMFGGADRLEVGDLSGTDLVDVTGDVAALGGGNDLAADNVVAQGTNGDDVIAVTGSGGSAQVGGLAAVTKVIGATPATDRLTVNGLAGDDVIDAFEAAANGLPLTLDGGTGGDVLVGGNGNDTLLGGDDDDVLIGGPGADVINVGPEGDEDVVIDDPVIGVASADGQWLAGHMRVEGGKTVVEAGGEEHTLPRADLVG